MLRTSSMTWFIATAVCLLFGAVAIADDLHAYVGFTGIQNTTVSGGTLHYVDLHIGSDESQSEAEAYTVFSTLVVKDANGRAVCNSSLEFVSRLRPAVRPLRFQVSYPTSSVRGAKRTRLAVPKTRYTLFGKIEVRGSASKLLDSDANQMAVEFPGGGSPSCGHLMPGQSG